MEVAVVSELCLTLDQKLKKCAFCSKCYSPPSLRKVWDFVSGFVCECVCVCMCVGDKVGGWGLMRAVTQLLISDETWSTPQHLEAELSCLSCLCRGGYCSWSSSQRGSPPWELASVFSAFGFLLWPLLTSSCPGSAAPVGSVLRLCSSHLHASFLMGTRTLVHHHQKANVLYLPADAIQN